MPVIPGRIMLTKEGMESLLNGEPVEANLKFLTSRVIIEVLPQAIKELSDEKKSVIQQDSAK
jgi:hypothetical protein